MKKVVIVTGAGRGIGAATAILLASQGYAVCVNYLSKIEAPSALLILFYKRVGKHLLLPLMWHLKQMF